MKGEFVEVGREVLYAVVSVVAGEFKTAQEAKDYIERIGTKGGPDLLVVERTKVTSILKD